MRNMLLLGTMLSAASLHAQSAQPEPQAIIVALRHLRADLPDTGAIALVAERALTPDDARGVAAALGAELRTARSVNTCATENGRWSCRFRDLVGALSLSRSEQLSGDRARIVAWTHVQMHASHRSWIHGRQYEVVVVKTVDGTWVVESTVMIGQT